MAMPSFIHKKREAEQVFFNQPLLVLADQKHSRKEARYHALGKSDEARLLHITFTLRSDNTLIRVISARDMPYQSLIKSWLADDVKQRRTA